jgi:Enoyl-(Acyl carrier protein) reductase
MLSAANLPQRVLDTFDWRGSARYEPSGAQRSLVLCRSTIGPWRRRCCSIFGDASLPPPKLPAHHSKPGEREGSLWQGEDVLLQVEPMLRRLGEPEDISDIVAFLVSDGGRWITGQNIGAGSGMF